MLKRCCARRPDQPQAMPVARSSRRLPPFGRGDDIGEAIFLRTMLAIRDVVPSLGCCPLHELESAFGDLKLEIDEIIATAR